MSDDTPDWQPEDGAGYMPTEERTTETVPKEDLRALIEEWRKNPSFEVTQDAPYQAIKQCADELEELINDNS